MILGAAMGAGVTYQLLKGRATTDRLDDPLVPQLNTPAVNNRADEFGRPPAVQIPEDELPPIVRNMPNALPAAVQSADSFAAAFAAAMAESNPMLQQRSLRHIAEDWAARAPEEAFAALRELTSPPLRQTYLSAFISSLFQADPETAVSYINRLTERIDLGIAAREIVSVASTFEEPTRLLAVADNLRSPMFDSLRLTVVSAWAQRDPTAALDYASALPDGQAKQMAMQMVLRSYAASDPDAALAWVDTIGDNNLQFRASVISGLAESDPMRALDLMLDSPEAGRMEAMRRGEFMGAIFQIGMNGGEARVAAADRLLETGTSSLLSPLVSSWAQNDPGELINWLRTNSSAVPVEIFQGVAQIIGQQSPNMAAEFTAQVPEAARGEWISAVAQSYARNDPEAALAWLQQYQSEPAYAQGVAAIVQASAIFDPPAAAEMLNRVDLNTQQGQMAVATVTSTWMQADTDAARRWVTNLPRGRARDMGISVIAGNLGEAVFGDSLLQLVSSDEIQNQIVVSAIVQTAAEDKDRARDLMNQHISDPRAREQLEFVIENAGTMGVSVQGQAFRAIGPGVSPAVPLRVR